MFDLLTVQENGPLCTHQVSHKLSLYPFLLYNLGKKQAVIKIIQNTQYIMYKIYLEI